MGWTWLSLALVVWMRARVGCGADLPQSPPSFDNGSSAPGGAEDSLGPGSSPLSQALPPGMQGPDTDQFGKIVALNCTSNFSVCGGEEQMIQNITYRFIGNDFTEQNNTFKQMITSMQPVLRNIEKALSVRIEMLTRPGTPSVIYGPDGINGSKVAYAPTPGQVPVSGMRKLLQASLEEPAQGDDFPARFTRFQSTDVELQLIGNSTSSLLDFYNSTALQNFGEALRGNLQGVSPMPFNISTTLAILPITEVTNLTKEYALGTVLQVTGANQFPINTQTQTILLRGLQDLCSKNGSFLYHRLQSVWADSETSIVRHAILTYVTKPMASVNELTGADIGTLMNQLAPKIGANFTVFVQFSVFLGNRDSELEGAPSFTLNVSQGPQTKDKALAWWQILLICIGGCLFLGLIGGTFALAYNARKLWPRNRSGVLHTTTKDLGSAVASPSHGLAQNSMFECSTPPGSTKGQSSMLTSVESSKASFQVQNVATDCMILEEELVVFQDANGADCILGQGKFGCVFKGSLRGEQVAIKQLNIFASLDFDSFAKEMGQMHRVAQIRDATLVHFHGMCITESDSMLVYEYVAGGNLCDALLNDTAGQYRWDARGSRILFNIAQGLAFLHGRGIVHGDLKCKNILLTEDHSAKIADVGLLKLVGQQLVSAQLSAEELFAYAAPEVVKADICTLSSDIYSLGVLMHQLLTHELPIRGELRAINVPSEAPEQVADLVLQCLSYEPLARPTASDVLNVLQQASSLIVWWGGHLQTVHEVSESGLQTDSSKTQSQLTSGPRSRSHSSNQSGAPTQSQEQAQRLVSSQERHLRSIRRMPTDSSSATGSRESSSDVEAQDSKSRQLPAASDSFSSGSTDTEVPGVNEGLNLQAQPLGSAIKDSSQAETLSGGEAKKSRASLIGTGLDTSETELQEISDAADHLLDSSRGIRQSSGKKETGTSSQDTTVQTVLLPRKSFPQTHVPLAESQPSQALSFLSDDSRGKENMAKEAFAGLEEKPSVLFDTGSQFQRMPSARMGVNQHEVPLASWEKNTQEQSGSTSLKTPVKPEVPQSPAQFNQTI